MTIVRAFTGAAIFAAAAGITGCNGGGAAAPAFFSGSTPAPAATATPTAGATATPTATPTGTVTPTPTPTPAPLTTPTPVSTPTPGSTPTPVPTPTPAAVVASPAALSFNTIGAANAQPLHVSESGYPGNFDETDTCAGIVQVSPTSNIPASSGNVTVTPVAAGTCSIRVSDQNAVYVDVPVTVTSSGLTVSGRRAHR